MRVLILLLSFVALNTYAAAELQRAKVQNVRIDKGGFGYVRFDRVLEGTPASCSSGHDYHLSFDTNEPGGQAIMSLALSAQATGKYVLVRGTGACNHYSIVEGWSWGYVTN